MAEAFAITCPQHACVLVPDPLDPVRLCCPDAGCDNEVRITVPDAGLFLSSPLTMLEQGAAQHHELVLAHVAAGFSRTEAMQILCCIISASIMKGSGL